MIAKPYFKGILDSLILQDFDPLNKTIQGSIGFQPNPFLTLEEAKKFRWIPMTS
jgi:hypothetical protein